MISPSRIIRLLPFLFLFTACGPSYPDGLVEELHEEGMPSNAFSYYSPSIVSAFTSMDSSGTAASLAYGIYDVKQFSPVRGIRDTAVCISAIALQERVDALEGYETILPPLYEGEGSVRVLGKSIDNKLKLILIVRQSDAETIELTEIRGDNLRSNITRAMMLGMMNGNLNIPFLK